jgi:hypothetical protein
VKEETDQYSILQQIVDCLCPKYPEGLSPLDILHQVARTSPDLSLHDLIQILDFYERRGCLEAGEGKYRISRSLIWVGDGISSRRDRLFKFAGTVTAGMEGFLRGVPYNNFRVVRLFGSQREFDDFMNSLKQFLDDWFSRNTTPPAVGSPSYVLTLITSRAEEQHGDSDDPRADQVGETPPDGKP